MSTERTFAAIRPWILVWVLLMGLPSAASAITPKDEDELAREFMRFAVKRLQFVDDPMVVDYVNGVGKKLLSVMPPQPFTYRFYVIHSDVYNAFAIPAGRVFINSGLLAAMDNEDELAGILGHEIAHVTARHISDRIERQKAMSWATIAGMVAGAFLGGGGGAAVAQGTAAATTAVSLAYSRDDERQADQLGLLYLDQAGYSARGLLSVMQKIRGKEWYDTADFPDYLSTHPGSQERLITIGSWIEQNPDRPAAGEPKRTRAFAMVQARLMAVYGDEDTALRHFSAAVKEKPDDPVVSYGYGLVLARKGNLDGATAELRRALERDPFDPYLLNEMGRIYFLAGRYPEAVDSLQGAVSLAPDQPRRSVPAGPDPNGTRRTQRGRRIPGKPRQPQGGLPEGFLLPGQHLRKAGSNGSGPLLSRCSLPHGGRRKDRPVSSGAGPGPVGGPAHAGKDSGGDSGDGRGPKKRQEKEPVRHHLRSKCEKCMLNVPLPWVADRRAVE